MKKKRYGTPTINFSLIGEVNCAVCSTSGLVDDTDLIFESDEELE